MEDGIERSMSSLVTELEKKQRIITMPKYEEQVHPIGLSLTGIYDTTPIGHDNTPIGRQEACPKTGRQDTIDKTLGTRPIHNLQETPSTNTGSDS
jgi:hypothetical protein